MKALRVKGKVKGRKSEVRKSGGRFRVPIVKDQGLSTFVWIRHDWLQRPLRTEAWTVQKPESGRPRAKGKKEISLVL